MIIFSTRFAPVHTENAHGIATMAQFGAMLARIRDSRHKLEKKTRTRKIIKWIDYSNLCGIGLHGERTLTGKHREKQPLELEIL